MAYRAHIPKTMVVATLVCLIFGFTAGVTIPLMASGAPPREPWWCVCYQEVTSGAPAMSTACRTSLPDCEKLEERIAAGGRGIVRGSLATACTAAYGEHPGDMLGGRDTWQDSAKEGSYVTHAGCLLGRQGSDSPHS